MNFQKLKQFSKKLKENGPKTQCFGGLIRPTRPKLNPHSSSTKLLKKKPALTPYCTVVTRFIPYSSSIKATNES